jgi:hypothetical protein
MEPVTQNCSAAFHVDVAIDRAVTRIGLGIPGGTPSQEYGLVWSRSARDQIYCPPVCSTGIGATVAPR